MGFGEEMGRDDVAWGPDVHQRGAISDAIVSMLPFAFIFGRSYGRQPIRVQREGDEMTVSSARQAPKSGWGGEMVRWFDACWARVGGV